VPHCMSHIEHTETGRKNKILESQSGYKTVYYE
jgi:hypothetical protein